MLTIRAMTDGSGYSARHLQHSDYYAEGERIRGHWQGGGANLLKLTGEVRTEQFEALRQGLDPSTDEFLRQRQSVDRIAADGTTQSHGRNLYDFTISAPKSVSIMATVGGDLRLVEAHRLAVQETLKELEQHAGTRVRMNTANHNRCTGNLVLAVYHHDASRELDPQLHTHAVAANLTYDGAEGRWKALQASEIYERRAYLTEVYRNALAREVRSLGYEIEDRRGAIGKDSGFEIKGVTEGLLERYSQRSEQRDKAIAQFIEANNRPPTDNEVAILVRESRADKLIEISSAEVHARQRDRLSAEEGLALLQIRDCALGRGQIEQHELKGAASSLQHAERHVFERVSVAVEHQLLTEALRHGRGQIDLGQLKAELCLQEARGEVLRAGQEVATRDSLNREREMIARVNRGIDRFGRLGGAHDFGISDQLRPEQRKSVEFVLASGDLAVNLRGAAGTGKTETLQEVHKGLQQSGREVVAVAPTMSAVDELRKVGFHNAVTVERLLQNRAAQSELPGRIIIVDEAGMVSGRQMSELLKIAEQNSARVVFSGDTNQIRSVEACDALRVLERESHLRSISLTGVQRQTVQDYREAIQELRTGPKRGLDRLEAMGAIREVLWLHRAQAVQQAYFESKSESNAKQQPRSVLVVAPTHDEIRQITKAIRSELTRRCELGDSVRLVQHIPMNWTRAEKGDIRNYREGQVLKFHRSVNTIRRGESLQVTGVEADRLVAKNARGDEREVTAKHAGCFVVYERQEIEIAPGERLLLMSNRREDGFRATNGELVIVSRIDQHNRIHLQDGRVLPEDYKEFSHGYAVTVHRSQGKSVDSVVISADGMRKELFYVAASRGRESVTVVTSDREVLRETVAQSDVRLSASDLAVKARLREHQRDLRAMYRDHSAGFEPQSGVSGNSDRPVVPKDLSLTQSDHQNQQMCQLEHQHAAEPSHSLDLSH